MTWKMTAGALRFNDTVGVAPIVTDGSMGIELSRRGFALTPPDRYNIDQHVVIEQIYHDFIDAGATLIQSNSLYANHFALEAANLSTRVHEINRRSVWIARQAAGSRAIVAGVIGPTGRLMRPLGPLTPEDATTAFLAQASALLEAGADVMMLKSFVHMDELALAIDAVRSLSKKIPVIALKSFPEDGSILAGSFPSEIAAKILSHGVNAFGSNGTVGPQRMIGIVQSLRTSDVPMAALPDVGIPTIVDGNATYNADPAYVGDVSKRLVEHGAAIIGADGGATVEHIRAIARSVHGVAIGSALQQVRQASLIEHSQASRLPNTAFHDALGKRLLTTVELDIPRGIDMQSVLDGARYLAAHGIDAVNISDGARARLRMSSIAISQLVKQHTGMDCITHLSCRDRNMVGLQSEVLGAHAMGVRNILAVTGDPTHIGDFPSATSVYDVDSIGLIRALGRMNHGQDLMGNPLGEPTSFCIACAVNPAADDLNREVDRLWAKCDEGAHVAFSQPVFDAELLDVFLDRIKDINVQFMLGVIPLRTIRHAEFLHYEVPGMMIPAWVRDRMRMAGADTEAATQTGIDIAVEFLRVALDRIDGVYLMPPFKKYDIAVRILDQLTITTATRATV